MNHHEIFEYDWAALHNMLKRSANYVHNTRVPYDHSSFHLKFDAPLDVSFSRNRVEPEMYLPRAWLGLFTSWLPLATRVPSLHKLTGLLHTNTIILCIFFSSKFPYLYILYLEYHRFTCKKIATAPCGWISLWKEEAEHFQSLQPSDKFPG